jgi:ABC-type nickel/cobalt efflux system permease component RcnA
MGLAIPVDAVIISVMFIGFLHGLEPGHGWPVAVLYSIRKDRPWLYGIVTSSIISFFHFISSITVVVAYMLLISVIAVPINILTYVSAAILIIMAIAFFREKTTSEQEEIMMMQHGHVHQGPKSETLEHEHPHEHPGKKPHTHMHKHTKTTALTLGGIAIFAAVLGFAHEEEFAILGLAVGGVDPLTLMLAYATSVVVALIGVTLLCIKAYERVHYRIRRYEKYIPKITGLTLFALALTILFGIQ